jgi:hypothetical protein
MIQKIAEYIAAHPQQLAGQIAAHIGISLIALLACPEREHSMHAGVSLKQTRP